MTTLYFDFDGTIVDVRRRHYRAYVDALRELGGPPLCEADYWARRLEGASSDAVLPTCEPAFRRRFLERWRGLVESQAYLGLDTLVSGARRALSALSGNHELVLVTMRRDRAALLSQLDDLAIDKFFRDIVCHADAPGAPSKTELLRFYMPPGMWEGAIVGDSEADIDAAITFGLRAVCVTTGVRSRRFLERAGAHAIVPSLVQVEAAVAERDALRAFS